MNIPPKISIITPNFQSGRFLETCIQSIIGQNYPNLEYIIMDGGSTDNSLEIIQKYESHLSYWTSEKDEGLYDALQKGFDKSSGEIMGWLNADDLLHPNALFTIAEIFQNWQQVKWLQGWPTFFDEHSRVVSNYTPINSKYFFLSNQFFKKNKFIQQESTYWHRSLWDQTGGFLNQNYKLAADLELWMRFFQREKLYLTRGFIGGFRFRGSGQLSIDRYQEYMDESKQIIQEYRAQIDAQTRKNLKKYQLYQNVISKIPLLRSWYAKKNADVLFTEQFLGFDFKNQKFYL